MQMITLEDVSQFQATNADITQSETFCKENDFVQTSLNASD
jgi:hypothetical protein